MSHASSNPKLYWSQMQLDFSAQLSPASIGIQIYNTQRKNLNTCLLCCSMSESNSRSFMGSCSASFIDSFIQWFIDSISHAFTQSFIQSLAHNMYVCAYVQLYCIWCLTPSTEYQIHEIYAMYSIRNWIWTVCCKTGHFVNRVSLNKKKCLWLWAMERNQITIKLMLFIKTTSLRLCNTIILLVFITIISITS